MARGQWQLVVTELPPGTSCQKVLEEIEEITNPKVKTGKKSLTPEQTQSKAVMLNLLDAVRDESGKDAAVRLVFEPKTSRVDRDEFVNTLLAQTSMESSASVNLVCIGTDGRPRQKGLRDILTEWLAFRTQTVTRRTRFRLDKVIDRIHVLEGRMVVYLNVDEVIQTIRESDEPRAADGALQADRAPGRRHPGNAPAPAGPPGRDQDRAGTGRQARRAGSPAGAAGQPGLAQAPAGQGNRGRRQAIWRRSPHADRDGRARRAGNQGAGRAGDRDRVAEGLAARAQGHGHDASQFGFKQGDDLYGAFECRTTDTLIAVGDNGRVYSVAVSGLPSARGDGQPITTMIDLESGSRIVHMIAAAADSRWLLATRGGGFAAKLSDMFSRQRAGKQFITLEAGDELLRPVPLFDGATQLALLSDKGKFLVFGLDEVKSLSGGGRGTILMGLDTADKLDQAVPIGAAGLRAAGVYRNKHRGHPGRRGAHALCGQARAQGRQLDVRPKQPVLSPVLG